MVEKQLYYLFDEVYSGSGNIGILYTSIKMNVRVAHLFYIGVTKE